MKIRTSTILAFLATILIATLYPASTIVDAATSVKAIVVRRVDGCDYFMTQMKTGYGILEWFGGHDPDTDDVLYGEMRSYGMRSIHDENADATIRVWVEDYDLSKSDAMEKLLDECE